jgi:hypothetical protein
MNRLLTTSIAWVVGVIIYLIAAFREGGCDGLPDLIALSMSAAVFSAVTVGLAVLIGWFLRFIPLGQWRQSDWRWAALAVAGSLVVLNFGSVIGLNLPYTDPTTGEQFAALHPAVAVGGYFLLIFAVAHWPSARQPDA